MKKILIAIIVVVLIAGGVAYAYGIESQAFDRFYSPEQQEARQLARLVKEFPQAIENYSLYGRSAQKIEVGKECFPSGGTDVCYKTISAEYRQTDGKAGIFIHINEKLNGDEDALQAIAAKQSSPTTLGSYEVVQIEKHELGWFPVTKYSFVLTQEGTYRVNSDGSESYSYLNKATGSNPVTSYFIQKYPPATNVQTATTR